MTLVPSLESFSDAGLITDFELAAADGETIESGGWAGVLAPKNPDYVWVNFLARPDSPRDGSEVDDMIRRFQCEIVSRLPGTHLRGAWLWEQETPGPAREAIEARKFHNGQWTTYIVAPDELHPSPRANPSVKCRPLKGDDDWEAAYLNQVAARGTSPFKRRQMQGYRALAERGLGFWWGAYLNEQLVADLGIFRCGDRARFQMVSTHPEFQRRGLCAALVYASSRHAFAHMPVRELVMVTESFYHAGSIYESVGFRRESVYFGAWG